MVKINKRGFLKTLEAVFAIIIFLIALSAIINMQQIKEELKPQDIELVQDTILNRIEHNQTYRDDIITQLQNDPLETITETYLFIESALQNKLEFETYVCKDIGTTSCSPATALTFPEEVKEVNIYADSIIIPDETDTANTRIFFLYLWRTFE